MPVTEADLIGCEWPSCRARFFLVPARPFPRLCSDHASEGKPADTCGLCGVDILPLSQREYVDQLDNKAGPTPRTNRGDVGMHEHAPKGPWVFATAMLVSIVDLSPAEMQAVGR